MVRVRVGQVCAVAAAAPASLCRAVVAALVPLHRLGGSDAGLVLEVSGMSVWFGLGKAAWVLARKCRASS